MHSIETKLSSVDGKLSKVESVVEDLKVNLSWLEETVKKTNSRVNEIEKGVEEYY